MDIILQHKPPLDEIKPYHCGLLKGFCLKGFENLDILSIPFDNKIKDYNGPYHLEKRTSSRCTVSFDFTTGGALYHIYAKRYRVRSFAKKLGYMFIPSKCIKEWRLGLSLLKNGIMTPIPLIAAEHRAGPFVKDNYLVTLGIEPFKSLKPLLKNMTEKNAIGSILENLAHFMRRAHDVGFYHDDLSLNHIYSHQNPGEERQFALIDLDNGRLFRQIPERLVAMNLFQILRCMDESKLPGEELMRFLESYLQNPPSKQLISRINSLSVRKMGRSVI
ncbi:hypothetical protein JW926_12940 [Candidatus Sumerlaeota bacterium]|nr:hypothetical protein [Candidatus Sumerlaeota bacterium]